MFANLWQNGQSIVDMSDSLLDKIRKPDGTYDFDKADVSKADSRHEHIMLEKEGNVFHCALRHDLKILSFKDEEIIYEMGGLHAGTPDCAYNDILENDDILTIKFDFIKENDEITIDGNAPFSLSSGEYGAITSVHMTSLSLDLLVEWENGPLDLSVPDFVDDLEKIREYMQMAKDEMNKAYPELRVRFKDGTVAENNALSWNNDYSGSYDVDSQNRVTHQSLIFNWKYPVKVEDIDAIIICDGEFKIN